MFRRDTRGGDAFQRQINQLREQLGAEGDEVPFEEEVVVTRSSATWSEEEYSAPREAASSGYPYATSGYGSERTESAPAGSLAVIEPTLPSMPMVDALATVIAAGAAWKGELTTEKPIHLHGNYEGTVNSENEVFVAESAIVDAAVNAASVIVAGTVSGAITCTQRLEVLPSGRVTGQVSTPSLVVHNGASIEGQVRMGGTGAPAAANTRTLHRRQGRTSA